MAIQKYLKYLRNTWNGILSHEQQAPILHVACSSPIPEDMRSGTYDIAYINTF